LIFYIIKVADIPVLILSAMIGRGGPEPFWEHPQMNLPAASFGIPSRQYIRGSGTYIEVLREMAGERGLGGIPFIGMPEVEEVGRLDETLPKIEGMLRR
jgi:hypothetical protein